MSLDVFKKKTGSTDDSHNEAETSSVAIESHFSADQLGTIIPDSHAKVPFL